MNGIPGCPLSPAVLRRRIPSSYPGPGDGSNENPNLAAADMGSKTKLTDKVMQNAMTTALQDDLPFVLFSSESLVKYEEQRNKVLQEYGFLPKRQPSILDGSILPKRFEPVPAYFYNKPIEELETGIYEKRLCYVKGRCSCLRQFSCASIKQNRRHQRTFCVLSMRFHRIYVNRLTATNSLFLFSPWNPIRKACVALVTNQYFDYLMILTILVNCVFLALTTPVEQAEYVFLSIYTTEMLIKSIAKGFVLNKYTYLRIPWNWLDFVVIVLGFVTIFADLGRLSGLRTFRVFRALKTVSILPGLKTIVNALLHSLKMLSEVMLLTVFCLMVFALFALQIYMGALRNKCVRTITEPMSDEAYRNFTLTSENWEMDEESPIVCGNSSGAMPCSENYTCLPNIGDNPNFGYTSFDNFGSAMLTTFQLITLDFWENVYDKIIGSNGPLSVIFFILVVFFGSFYLVNLMLAVVAMSYEEEVEATQSELNRDRVQFDDAETQNTPTKKPKKKRIITRRGAITVNDPVSDTENELPEPPPTNPLPPRTAAERDPTREPAILKVLPVMSRTVQDTGVPGVPYSRYNKNTVNGRNTSKQNSKNNPNSTIKNANTSNNNASKNIRNNKPPNGAKRISNNQSAMTKSTPNTRNISNYGITKNNDSPNPPATKSNAEAPASFIMCECGLEVCDPSRASCTFAVGIPCVNDPKRTNAPSRPVSRVGNTLHPLNHTVSRDSATSTGTNTFDRALSELYKSAPEEEDKQVDIAVLDDTLPDRNCKCCSHCCCQYTWWLKFQKLVYNIVYDPLIELFITACIIANTVFLAIEHHGMSPQLKEVLNIGNKVFTAIFTIETVLKLTCLSKDYFKNAWNVFDLTIVFFSLIEMGLENINGLSVLRALRLLRVFKLAQSWTTMRVLLSIIVSTLGALGNLTLVLVIIMYIFAVLGMQLFGNNYRPEKFPDNEVPRWNFRDFVHSFMMIFRVLCGEWIEPMWDCMKASGESCMAIFIPALVVGNFMVLNLFLALLLSSFNSEELAKNNKKDEEVSRLMMGIKRLQFIFCCCCRFVSPRFKKERRASVETILSEKGDIKDENMTSFSNSVYEDNEEPRAFTIPTTPLNNRIKTSPLDSMSTRPAAGKDNIPIDRKVTWSPVVDYVDNLRRGSLESLEINDTLLQVGTSHGGSYFIRSDAATQTSELNLQNIDINGDVISRQPTGINESNEKSQLSRQDSESDVNKSTINMLQEAVSEEGQSIPLAERNPEDCFPQFFYKRCCCCKSVLTSRAAEGWFQFRKKAILIVDHWIFEWAILILIFASSVTLCFEDKYLDDNKPLKETLYYLNIVFCVIYGLEMILKWLAHGLMVYFSNGWSFLDFIIVMASILSVVVDGNKNLVALRSVRTLRALRPLRAISRWQGMKIVVNALMSAIPSIFNVLLVCIVFWLIFSIMGVQFFAGRFYRCVDEDDKLVDTKIVKNRTDCEALVNISNYRWTNPEVNFDNVGRGYLALFQVATFEGWMEVMEYAVDARGVDLQPEDEANLPAYLYFIVFIVCGSFFTLNLFIGVIIDNFNMLKKKYEGGVLNIFLTESQKNYYAAMKKLGRKKPQKLIRRPINKCQALFYDLSMSRRFEMVVFIIIMANMICMGIEHYGQTEETENILDLMNIIFTSLFVVEAVIKIIGLRHYYFTVLWNVFDFVLVVASILGIIMKDLLASTNFFVSPTLLRVLRVFRIGRILRLIKAAKGIRKLLFALVVSLPALFNIGALIFLIMFIYAIIGMSLFSRIRHNGAIDAVVNFETFGRSILLLFRLLTSAGWNDILDALMVQEPECDSHYQGLPNGDCGNSTFAIIYLVSYVIINFMIIINMYIAVILENFNQAHQEEELGIVEDDLEMFYVNWAKYDPYATQFISFWELDDFVDTLDPPLRIAKPNNIAIVSFNLPIAKGMKIHCLDILHALVKHELGHVEETEDFQKLRSQMEEKFKKQFPTRKHLELVTTTLQWKRYDFAARIVQKAFNRHKSRKLREQQGMVEEPSTSARPTSKLGRGLRTLSQFLNLPRALPGSAVRRSARSRPVTSKSQRSTNDEDVDRIFYTQPKT